jgi:hypothetical protein
MRTFPQARVIGYEVFCPAWLISVLRFWGCKRVQIKGQNFMEGPLDGADVGVGYLSFDVMARLGPKLKVDMKTGTLVISGSFPIPGWTPLEVIPIPGPIKAPIYVYRV